MHALSNRVEGPVKMWNLNCVKKWHFCYPMRTDYEEALQIRFQNSPLPCHVSTIRNKANLDNVINFTGFFFISTSSLIICWRAASNLISSPFLRIMMALAPSTVFFKTSIISSISSLSSFSESPKPGVSTMVNSVPSPSHGPTTYLVFLVQEVWPSQMGNEQLLQSTGSPTKTFASVDLPWIR